MEKKNKNDDMANYGYETRIYSADGEFEHIITDEDFLKQINQCEHPFALFHQSKDTIIAVEEILSPLKPKAELLIIESKGGSVVSKMTLTDFFCLLDLGKRIEIFDRDAQGSSLKKGEVDSFKNKILEFADKVSRN